MGKIKCDLPMQLKRKCLCEGNNGDMGDLELWFSGKPSDEETEHRLTVIARRLLAGTSSESRFQIADISLSGKLPDLGSSMLLFSLWQKCGECGERSLSSVGGYIPPVWAARSPRKKWAAREEGRGCGEVRFAFATEFPNLATFGSCHKVRSQNGPQQPLGKRGALGRSPRLKSGPHWI